MPESNPSLAALVGSRLCHDLISPIGAIQNGLELLEMSSGQANGPELALIQESSASATSRIRFFRVAFGGAKDGQVMGHREIATNLTDMTTGSRIQTEWATEGDQKRTEVQLAYLAFLCAETSLPTGGKVSFVRDDLGWHITATGSRVSVDAALWKMLEAGQNHPDLSPDKVQFALLGLLCQERGFKPYVRADDTKLRLDLRPV